MSQINKYIFSLPCKEIRHVSTYDYELSIKEMIFRYIEDSFIMEEMKEALAQSESARLKLEEENHLLQAGGKQSFTMISLA